MLIALITTIPVISEVIRYKHSASLYQAFHQLSQGIIIVENEHEEMIYCRMNLWEYD